MKIQNFKQIGTAAILTAVLALNSCQKEEVLAPKKNNTVKAPTDITAISFGKVDRVQSDVMLLAEALVNGELKKEGVLSCATVTRDEISMPHHAIIDYGTGCTDGDGVTRTGRVDVYYNFSTGVELRNNAGSQINVQFTDFHNGDVAYDGTALLVNAGPNGDLNNVFEIDVNVTFTDQISGDITYMNGGNDFEFTRGYNTHDKSDDALSVTGTITGTHNGDAFSTAVTPAKPLIKYRSEGCDEHYVQGEMVYTYASSPTEVVDYGDGTCDNLAMKTVGTDPAQEITLD